MAISKDAAERLVAELKSCCDSADRLLLSMASTLGQQEFADLRKLVGQFMGDAYLNIVRPLQRQFPGLPFDAYQETAGNDAPQPQDFPKKAAAVLERHRAPIQACEESGLFRPGALHEVEASVQGVHGFMARSDRS